MSVELGEGNKLLIRTPVFACADTQSGRSSQKLTHNTPPRIILCPNDVYAELKKFFQVSEESISCIR